MNNNIHVVPHGDDWAVKRSNAERASSICGTQEKAINLGRRMAINSQTELVIHRPNGQIRDKDSFGNDPCPPKDRR